MSVTGHWKVVIHTPVGERYATLDLVQEDEELSGQMTNDEGRTEEIDDATLEGDQISWKAKIEKPMSMTLKFSGAIEGDQINGTVALGPLGKAPFRGTRDA